MVDQNLPAKVVASILTRVSINGNIWKDEVLTRVLFGRNADVRTVEGGAPDVIPGESISTFEFETPMTTDLADTVHPPTDVNTLSYWIYQIFTIGNFPTITFTEIKKNAAGGTATLQFSGKISEIVPGDKEEDQPSQKAIIRGIITAFTSFLEA